MTNNSYNNFLISPGVKTIFNNLWGSTKHFFDSIEPFQPLVATLTIIGKAGWKSMLKKKISGEIRGLKNRIGILREIHKNRKTDGSKRIGELKYQLECAKNEKVHILIASCQLGSLLFPHPGSNVWNSGNTLFGRIYSIRHHFAHSSFAPSNQVNGTLGTLSALGTATALLKQTGTLLEYTPFCHAIIGASFVAMAIESAILVKNWIRSRM